MKRFLVLSIGVFLIATTLLSVAFGEAVVTLKTGEILRGDLLSDTNNVLELRVYNANRTISYRRTVPRSDIQDFQNETQVQATERTDYFTLSKFQLDPDQEQSPAWYSQWIVAFDKFKENYPKSDKTPFIQEHIDVCQAELKHVSSGEVKFENKWMTPAEKLPQANKKQLRALYQQRDELIVSLGKDQGELTGLQQRLPNLNDQWANVDHPVDVDTGGTHHYHTVQHNFVNELVPNPDKPHVLVAIQNLQKKIGKDQASLLLLNGRIQSLENQLSQTHLVANQPQNQELASAQPTHRSTSPVRMLSRDEFHSRALGMHSSDLINYVGKPDSTREGTYSNPVWFYNHLTQDPANGNWDMIQVIFNNDIVSAVNF